MTVKLAYVAQGSDNDIDARLGPFVPVVSVADPRYGVKGDGSDETTKIRAVLAAGAGKRVVFPPPSVRYLVTGSLSVPANTEIEGIGMGGVEIQVPAGSAFPVFDVDGVSNVRISGFRGTKAAGAQTLTGAALVKIRGAASDITLERMTATAFMHGFRIAGAEGTVPGTARRITLRDVTGNDSPGAYGIVLDDCDTVTIDNCYGRGNGFDGLKLEKKTLNVTVRGGAFTNNGTSGSGDGIDAYAGGDRFVVDGTILEDNATHGLTIKSGELNQTDAANYGYVRNIQVIGVRARNNAEKGLYLTRNLPLDDTQPLTSCTQILGGEYEGNGAEGLYLNGRNVVAVAPVVKKNGTNGIGIALQAFDVRIVEPIVVANSQSAAGVSSGIYIAGKKVRVNGGTVLGVDADTVGAEGDYAALTKYHGWNIDIRETADEVYVDNVEQRYAVNASGIRSAMAAGTCIIRQSGTGSPYGGTARYGGIGSRYTRLDSTGSGVEFIKTSGAPNVPNAGWQRAVPAALTGRAVGTTQTAFAHGLGQAPANVWITPKGNITAWVSAASDATNVYITASAAGTVDLYFQ